MSHLASRTTRILKVGVLEAIRTIVFMVLVLMVVTPVMQAATQWRARGTLNPLPWASAAHVSAEEVTVVGASPREAAAVRRALSKLRYPVPLGSLTFVVTDQPCPDCSGEYVPATETIRVQRSVVRAGDLELQRALSHELGHFVDDVYLTDALRTRFRQLRGIPPSLEWDAWNRPWPDRPSEDFAETFAVLDMPVALTPPITMYGAVRDPEAVDSLLGEAGIWSGVVPPASWQRVVALETGFLASSASNPAFYRPALLVLALGGLLGALEPMWRAWRASANDRE